MAQSYYLEYAQKYFPGLVTSIVERINEKNATSLNYMYRDLLTPTYSVDGKWASILAEYTRVAADVVALDSELPLKSRDTLEVVSGEIPKMGMKLYLTETQIKKIDSMIAQNVDINLIVDNIFQDTPRCIEGIYERIEDIFLSQLSTGVGLNSRNNGTGVRIDVGFRTENKFGVAKEWAGNADTATPMSDLQKVFDKAMQDNNTITDMWVDDTWLQAFYANKQVREQYAFNMNFVGSNIPTLDFEQASMVVRRKFGVTLHRVARKVKTEINGVKNNHSPWATGVCAFTCDEKLGSLIWTTVAEATRPVAGTEYQVADNFILMSKYSTNDPFREITSSQAMVVPILNNVDRIYLLDSTQVQA